MEFSTNFSKEYLAKENFNKTESVVEQILKILDEKIKFDFSHSKIGSFSDLDFEGASTENKSLQNLSKILRHKRSNKFVNPSTYIDVSTINSHFFKIHENLKFLLTEIINSFKDDLIKNMQKNFNLKSFQISTNLKDSLNHEKNVINITNNFNSQLSIFNSLISNEEFSLDLELKQQSPFSIKFWREDTKDKKGVIIPNIFINDCKFKKKNSYTEDKHFDVITKSTRSSSSSKVSSRSRRLSILENITGSSLTYGEGSKQFSSNGSCKKYVTPFECKSQESDIDCKKINIPIYNVNQDTPIFQTEKIVQKKVNLSSLKKVSKNLYENLKKIESDFNLEKNYSDFKVKEKPDKKFLIKNKNVDNPSISLLLSIISCLYKDKLITPEQRRNLKEKVLERNEYFISKLIHYDAKRDFKTLKQEVLKLI